MKKGKVKARTHQQPRGKLPPMIQALEEMPSGANVRKPKFSRASSKGYKGRGMK